MCSWGWSYWHNPPVSFLLYVSTTICAWRWSYCWFQVLPSKPSKRAGLNLSPRTSTMWAPTILTPRRWGSLAIRWVWGGQTICVHADVVAIRWVWGRQTICVHADVVVIRWVWGRQMICVHADMVVIRWVCGPLYSYWCGSYTVSVWPSISILMW